MEFSLNLLHLGMHQKAINPQELENFLRSKIDASYNQEVFERQLRDVIRKDLYKYEENVLKVMKHKLLLQQEEKKERERKQAKIKQLEQRIKQTEERRKRQIQLKMKHKMQQKRQKEEIFKQKQKIIQELEQSRIQKKAKKILEKQRRGSPKYNKLNRSISLLEELPYQRSVKEIEATDHSSKTQSDIFNLSKGQSRKGLKKRQLSLAEMAKVEENKYDQLNKQSLGKKTFLQPVTHQENKLRQRVNSLRNLENQSNQRTKQKYDLFLQKQSRKQQTLINRFSNSLVSLHSSSTNCNRLHEKIGSPLKNSVIYEQSQDREKYSYRRLIKEQIKEFMLRHRDGILPTI